MIPNRSAVPARARWINLSLIEHHVYCRRQAILIDREPWTENVDTAHGRADHLRIDSAVRDHRRGITVHHSVPLRHDGLRLRGLADTVEEDRFGSLVPVEHKSGSSKGDVRAATLQAAAQALCLAHMTGFPVPEAVVYFRGDNARVVVVIAAVTEPLLAVIDALRIDLADSRLPNWSTVPALCRRCSLRQTCLPELAKFSDVS